MTTCAQLRRTGALATCLLAGSLLVRADGAAAQAGGFGSLPVFAWPQPGGEEQSRWAGSYTRLSTGFEAMSSKRFGSYAGPTVGLEGGRMWQEGDLVYGVVGSFNYLSVLGDPSPGRSGLTFSRDVAGTLQVKVGTLVTPDILLYAKAGATAVHDRWRFGPTPLGPAISRDDIAIRPDARVGVEWALTDRITVGVEAGTGGRGLRW